MLKSKFFYSIFSTGLILCIYVATALPVDNAVTGADISAIKSLNLDAKCAHSYGDFDAEIVCLSAIQAAIQSIGEKRCAASSDLIEPSEFIRRNYGCCFDRARFIEKAARYYDYETRHIFLIQPKFGISLTNLLPLGQSSHATTEVSTSKGWLGIDSNEPFILLDQKNNPSTYYDAVKNIERFSQMMPRDFFTQDISVIYGLYSRHGNFYGKNFPGPEYVFSELLWNWN